MAINKHGASKIIDTFTMYHGLASCRINMCQARHVSVLFVGLGSVGSGSWCCFSTLLAPAGSDSTTTASASALASMLERHGDHVVGFSRLLIHRRVLPL